MSTCCAAAWKRGWPAALSALVLIGFVTVGQLLMPRVNEARDADLAGHAGAGQRFKCLHGLSVVINGAQWLAVLAALWMLIRFQPIAG